MPQVDSIYIYDAPDVLGLDIGAIGRMLSDLLPETQVETRTDFFTHQLARFEASQVEMLTEQIAARLEEREVHNLIAPQWRDEMAPIAPEERGLETVYLAEALQEVMRPLIPESERGSHHLHIVYIAQCLGQFLPDRHDLALQIVQFGEPAIVSTTGFVEAPALPREYAFRRAQLLAMGLDEALDELDDHFAASTLGYEDQRVTIVAAGHALQVLFDALFGERGCDVAACPLHQADTHEDLATAHLSEDSKLCQRHMQMLTDAGIHPRGA